MAPCMTPSQSVCPSTCPSEGSHGLVSSGEWLRGRGKSAACFVPPSLGVEHCCHLRLTLIIPTAKAIPNRTFAVHIRRVRYVRKIRGFTRRVSSPAVLIWRVEVYRLTCWTRQEVALGVGSLAHSHWLVDFRKITSPSEALISLLTKKEWDYIAMTVPWKWKDFASCP